MLTPLEAPYKIPPNADLELTVAVRYVNRPSKFAIAPKFPKKKTYSWWVILGDTEVDELVSSKRVMMPAHQGAERKTYFSFCSPAEDEGESFTLSVILLSDSYVGLDQQYDVEVTSSENAPVPPIPFELKMIMAQEHGGTPPAQSMMVPPGKEGY